jgi:hypothetical protein
MWFVANSKDAKEKIGHAIRDNINFRIGIALRNMGQEESKEVPYEMVQEILDRKSSDVGSDASYQEDVKRLEIMLEACFESDDLSTAAKPKTKVQQGIMKRVKRTSSGGSGDAIQAANTKNRRPKARTPFLNGISYGHGKIQDYAFSFQTVSIDSCSSASDTTSPSLAPLIDTSDQKPPASNVASGKVKAPLKKRNRSPAALPLSHDTVQSTYRTKVPASPNGLFSADSSRYEPSHHPSMGKDPPEVSPVKPALIREAIGILSSMRDSGSDAV